MKEGLTTRERLSIVAEAIKLIRLPDTFVQGAWKCPLYERPKTGEKVQVIVSSAGQEPTPDKIEGLKPALDEKGRPMFAYCVEGAINQAGLNILGEDRAILLGAARSTIDGAEIAEDESFSEYLSVNEVARVMYAEIFEQEFGRYWNEDGVEAADCPARTINDLGAGPNSSSGNKEKAHRRILAMLERRMDQLRDKKLAGV